MRVGPESDNVAAMRWFVALLVLAALAAPASAQAPEEYKIDREVPHKRPDPEVIEDKTPAPVPMYSGATVNIIRSLKSQEYSIWHEGLHNDSCCWGRDRSCCFPPLWKMRE
jgi:hypothetical protein